MISSESNKIEKKDDYMNNLSLEKKKKLDAISIDEKVSVKVAFTKMDSDNVRLLCVFSDDIYKGILSAGDIQRAIIANTGLETPCGEVLRKEGVRLAHVNESFSDIKGLMLKFRTEFMPVLNDKNELVDVYFWDEVFTTDKPEKSKIDVPVVVMAGGKGTRLKPFSNIIPKPLFPLGDKTIIEEIMDRFEAFGCGRFFLSLNHKADFIENYLNNEIDRDYDLTYFRETEPLGTAGSLFLVKDKIKETFFISNCDIVIDTDYSEILEYHREQQNEITLVVSLKHIKIPYGTVKTTDGGQITELEEKPEITYKANTGVYIVEPKLLDEIEPNKFLHITELVERIRQRGGKVGAFPVSEKSWCDIGEWAEYRRTLSILNS